MQFDIRFKRVYPQIKHRVYKLENSTLYLNQLARPTDRQTDRQTDRPR